MSDSTDNDNNIVFQNNMYKVAYGTSPFKYQRFSKEGVLIDAGFSYQIINKQTGGIEEEQTILSAAVELAIKFEEAYQNLLAPVAKINANEEAQKIVTN